MNVEIDIHISLGDTPRMTSLVIDYIRPKLSAVFCTFLILTPDILFELNKHAFVWYVCCLQRIFWRW